MLCDIGGMKLGAITCNMPNFVVYYWGWGLFLFEFFLFFFYFVVLSFSFTLQSALADKLTVLSGEWVPFSLKKRFEKSLEKTSYHSRRGEA